MRITADELASIINDRVNKAVRDIVDRQYRRGIVMSVSGDKRTCGVRIDGNSTTHPSIVCLAPYIPTVNDRVLILSIGTTGMNLVVLGRLDNTNAITYTDANGWFVRDYGAYKTYEKTWTVSVAVTNGQRALAATSAQALPVGISTTAGVRMYPGWVGNYAGHAVTSIEAATGGGGTTFDVYLGNQYSGSALTFQGKYHLLLIGV